jgi:hypothetical protein
MPEPLPGTALARDQIVPGVALVDSSTGRSLALWGFRGRRSQVLCFLHPRCPECRAFLERLEGVEEDIRLADGMVRAVAEEEVGGPFPTLLDPDGAARAAILGGPGRPPVVLVLDRYGAAAASFPAPGHDFPHPSAVTATLWHLALACPECGIMAWE